MLLAVAAQGADLNFDIPAGDLVARSMRTSSRPGSRSSTRATTSRARRPRACTVRSRSQQALDALLKGTGLQLRRDASGAVVIFPAEAVAGGASTKTAGGDQKLEEVIVTATPISHIYVTSRSVSRLDTDPMHLPQSVTAVQGDLLYAQQATSLTDVLNNVAGMEVGAANNVQSRGFEVSSARNGTMNAAAANRNQIRLRPTVATERVEVVKGPEQILQGSFAGVGGTVNVITKVPQADAYAYVGTAMGSREYWRVDGEVNGTLLGGEDGRLMGLVIGSFSDSGNGPKDIRGTSQDFVATGLRWEDTQLGTDLSVVYEYNDTSDPAQLRTATTGKTLHNGAKQYLFGAANSRTDSTENTVDVNFLQRIWGSWKLGVNYIWRDQTSDPFQGDGFPTFANPEIVSASQGGAPAGTTSDVIKVEVRGEFDTGPVGHKVLVAYDDVSDSNTYYDQKYFGKYLTDLNTGVKTYTPFDPVVVYPGGQYERSDTGVLVIDQLNWGKWHALLGFRWLSQDSWYKDDYGVEKLDADSTLPQLGLVYAVNPSLSLYASASEGYTANFYARDFDGNLLPDESFAQAEGGVKALMLEQQLVLTVAVYQIKQKDVATFAGVNPDTGEYYGKTIPGITSQGVEVEVSGQPIRGLQMRASFAGASSSEDKSGEPPYFGYIPYKFSLWTQYWIGRDAGKGWWVGGGLNANDAPVRTENQVGLTGATIFDLSGGYETDHWSAIAGVKNVGNVVANFPTSGITFYGTGLAFPYPGREYRFDLSYRF